MCFVVVGIIIIIVVVVERRCIFYKDRFVLGGAVFGSITFLLYSCSCIYTFTSTLCYTVIR